MGVTSTSIQLIEKVLALQPVKTVLELGAQNLYDKAYTLPIPYASTFYESKGIEYKCVDLNGENNALKIDLEKSQTIKETFDLVTDFGTGEHVRNAYNLLKIIHDSVKLNGIVIRQNPKTGNWAGHGFWYTTQELYQKLAYLNGYEIIDIGEDAAMGNVTDGWNVWCIYRKVIDQPFISRVIFESNISIGNGIYYCSICKL